MSDEDFEAYLTLLSRFLRLDGRQREEIRRELRAHLEEALEEEAAAGRSQEETLRRVLEDFGDAAELAARFSSLGRKRRWIMQGTMTAACIGVVVLAFNFPNSDAVPQAARGRAAAQTGGRGVAARTISPDEQVWRALRTELSETKFDETPFEQVLEFLAAEMDVNMHVQWRQLEEAGISRDAPIDVQLRRVTVERILRLVLDEFTDSDLDYEVLDGILVVSTRDALRRHTTTEVYNVRDILVMVAPPPAPPVAQVPPMSTGTAGGAGSTVREPVPPTWPAALGKEALGELLTNAIEPASWEMNGGAGYLQIFNDVLVVRQYEPVHGKIRKLLADLRATGRTAGN